MNVGSTIAGCFVGGMLVLSAPSVMAATVSSQLSEAFDTLDTLAAELDGRLGELGVPPQPDGPERLQQDDGSACPVRVAGFAQENPEEISMSCVSPNKIAARMGDLEVRFERSARKINEINSDLSKFRGWVVGPNICTDELAKDIMTAGVRLEEIDIDADCQTIAELWPCMDRLRQETNDELDRATSPVAVERFVAKLELVRSMNEQLIALEQTLHRVVSKRRRLLQELGEFRELEQKEDSCG